MSKTVSILIILLFNCVPIFGVAFYSWSVFEMFWLFWVETLIIACFNAVRVLYSQQNPREQKVSNAPLTYNVSSAMKYMLGRIFIFLFYSIFIITFIGFLGSSGDNKGDIIKTIAFLNPLFNLALVLCVCSQSFYLVKYFFLNGSYHYSSPADYPAIFDGRQIVMHIAVVGGGVGSAFFFKANNLAHFEALWIIGVLCICKTVYELIMLHRDADLSVSH